MPSRPLPAEDRLLLRRNASPSAGRRFTASLTYIPSPHVIEREVLSQIHDEAPRTRYASKQWKWVVEDDN